MTSGVAFHHAGLDGLDRHTVEKGFLEGQISVMLHINISSGVNLPCHLVIVKNTVTWQDNSWKEYADLDMMQMLGRAAGMPSSSSVLVIAVLIVRPKPAVRY
jgi:ATP-dependent DNA helicase HFM1/MER3